MKNNSILPDFLLLSSEQLEGWLVLYARAMTLNCVEELPTKLIEFVESDPKIMSRLNDIYDQIRADSDSFETYHLEAFPLISNLPVQQQPKFFAMPGIRSYALAAVIAIFMLASLAIYLYLSPPLEPTENIVLQNKIDSLNREITSLQEKKINEAFVQGHKDTLSKGDVSGNQEEAFFTAQKIKYPNAFRTDQTKELMIADAFASRGGNEPTVENPFEVKVFSPNKRAINEVNFRWEATKNKQKYTEQVRFRLYNNQKKLKDLPLNANTYRLNKADGLTDGLYYWMLETEDQQIFIGKFEFFTR